MANFLKKLELVGFKSFAGKTILEFPAGITAIVGPNGSGKSNVVDAIRWLLGERDAKSLRGGKVEDLIFAGTPERPRQGLAEASLHFDNRDGFFSVDFSEIVITRQVSRDGESRYFLNKSEVRLKDLVDFFAKARLGTKGLVVITQGNSDLFIKANPSERREMIEEMLGLREYQIKKNRAENQLKNTQINLDKVRALIEEILPHLRSLRRQTGRWEKRGVLEEELKNLEDSLFGSKWAWLSSAIKKSETELENHRQEFSHLAAEKKKTENHQKEVEAGEPKEREELRKIKNQTSELLGEQIRLEKNLSRLEAQIEMGQKSAATSEISLEKAIGLVKKIKSYLEASLSQDFDSLKNTIQALIQEITASLNTNLSDKKTSPILGDFQKQFGQINQELKEIKTKIENLKEKEKHLEKSQGEFYELFKKAVASVEAAKQKIEEWDIRNQKILFEKERFELRLEEIKRQIIQAGRHPNEFKETHSSSLELKHGLDSDELREIEGKIFKIRGDLASIGDIDESVLREAKETESRYEFLKRELEDTEKAKTDLRELIADLSGKIKTEFSAALREINQEFTNFFHLMFGGGHAKLILKKPERAVKTESQEKIEGDEKLLLEDKNLAEDEKEEGIDIDLSLPKKRLKSLEVLSGGERSLVGIAALFAMISVSPPPFLVLDEVDAALDERNARRFAEMLQGFAKKTQFIIITHNRASMEVANVLYGVTLSADGTSKILSLKLEPTPVASVK
ncbi:MAG: AAA family ATPase [Candidatus Liptonbacteria bacterium]|nr:AAA family ATPase [Candidatus Liptonbacteria bacterium]